MYMGNTNIINDLVRVQVCLSAIESDGTLKECISIINPVVSPGTTLRATLPNTNITAKSMAYSAIAHQTLT